MPVMKMYVPQRTVFKNSAMGFTRKDDARNYISSLNKDEIRRELIKI